MVQVLLTMGIAVDPADSSCGIVTELMQASLFDVIYEPSFRYTSRCLRHTSHSALLVATRARRFRRTPVLSLLVLPDAAPR
jgi:hypothetical protein